MNQMLKLLNSATLVEDARHAVILTLRIENQMGADWCRCHCGPNSGSNGVDLPSVFLQGNAIPFTTIHP